MKRPIAISLSPNTEKDDVLLALKTFFRPIKWFDFRQTEKLEKDFAKYFGKGYMALAVNSGRSAEYLILKALGIKADDEVIVQALTCVVVVNPILWLGAKPIYVDVDESFNMSASNLGKKIGEKTRAIIVQHSFGIPAEYDKIKKTVRNAEKKTKNKVTIIEDCAVSLGAEYKGKKVGTLGDVSFFSFGRDKVLSSVYGGMILCKDNDLYNKLKKERDNLTYPLVFWFIQQLFHPIALSLILPLYNVGYGKLTLGKILLFILQKARILSKAIYSSEKLSLKPKFFPQKMPGGLSILARNQFGKLEKFNKKRKVLTDFYFKNLKNSKLDLPRNKKGSIWLRFPVRSDHKKEVFNCMKRRKILLGDWYKQVVTPVTSLSLVNYKNGICPNAEKYSKQMFNLPTYPLLTVKQTKEVVTNLKVCLNTASKK